MKVSKGQPQPEIVAEISAFLILSMVLGIDHFCTDRFFCKRLCAEDKDVLVQCMCQWFGSAEACEANISSTVADALREKLGKFPYPYWAMLSTSLPLVWASHLPKANRPFKLLVSLSWAIFSTGPKRLTFYFQVLWASEAYMDHAAARIREESWQQAGAVVLDFLAWQSWPELADSFYTVLPFRVFMILPCNEQTTCNFLQGV